MKDKRKTDKRVDNRCGLSELGTWMDPETHPLPCVYLRRTAWRGNSEQSPRGDTDPAPPPGENCLHCLPSNVTQTAKQARFLEKTLFTPLDGNLGTPWLVWLTTTINKQELERIKSQMSCNRKQTFSCLSRTDLDPGVECPQTGMIGITLISQGTIA